MGECVPPYSPEPSHALIQAMRDRLEQQLSEHYAIERELGQGGMATVWLATDRRYDRRVAIKVLHEQLAGFRNVGYAHEREENTPGLGCFAVALPYRNPVLDAMSCSVPLGRLDPEHERQVISALLDAARTITELLRKHGQPGAFNPTLNCLPDGVPHGDLLPEPFKIIHSSGVIVMLYEVETTFRQIFTDGRKPPADPSKTAWADWRALVKSK